MDGDVAGDGYDGGINRFLSAIISGGAGCCCFGFCAAGRTSSAGLAGEAVLRVKLLPAHPAFVNYLEKQYAAGRTLVLASAADERIVRLVAERFKIFSSVIGSDGKINLRGDAKLRRLTELFGPKGFDYAGNSSVDLPVWRGAAEAIVVNASRGLEQRARKWRRCRKYFPDTPDGLNY